MSSKPGERKVRFSTEENQSYHVNLSREVHEQGPSLDSLRYKDPKERAAEAVAPPSSLSRPNYEDILRRVSVVLHKHIRINESRISSKSPQEETELDKFRKKQTELFSEDNFITPKYVYHFVRAPLSRLGFCYGIRQLDSEYAVPSLNEVYLFLRTLFGEAQLSAECSIVCLIYVERLMEQANVPLSPKTWRPCVICGLLLASKVWQDLSSWNSEIAEVYPQYSLQNINQLESLFCQHIKWDLYISSSLYAKYYFALRSLSEKSDFRRNYNSTRLEAPGAAQVAIRSENVKEAMLVTTLSKSL